MAHNAPRATGPRELVIRNIGLIPSGTLEKPLLNVEPIIAHRQLSGLDPYAGSCLCGAPYRR
jgi:hypothetical protein